MIKNLMLITDDYFDGRDSHSVETADFSKFYNFFTTINVSVTESD